MNKDQQLNKLFDAARSEAPKTSFDETKTQFIKQTSTTVSNQSLLQRLINIKNGFIMLAITSLINAGIIFFSGETIEEIIDSKHYRIDSPYRIYLTWMIPNINELSDVTRASHLG